MSEPKKYSALIVDDNWYNRDIFRIALENAGYQVTEVDDGQAGLDTLNAATFNLLVLDLQMPGLDGFSVLKQVRSHPEHKHMRVVVVTANAHMATDDVDNMADHVMYKPIDVVDFAQFTHRLRSSFDEEASSAESSGAAVPEAPKPEPASEPEVETPVEKATPEAPAATAKTPAPEDSPVAATTAEKKETGDGTAKPDQTDVKATTPSS